MAVWKTATPAAALGNEDAFPGLPVQRAVTPSELALHNTKKDSWIAIKGKVYDVSKFHSKHPGEGTNGEYLYCYAGKDCTTAYEHYHFTETSDEWLELVEKGLSQDIIFIGKYVGTAGTPLPSRAGSNSADGRRASNPSQPAVASETILVSPRALGPLSSAGASRRANSASNPGGSQASTLPTPATTDVLSLSPGVIAPLVPGRRASSSQKSSPHRQLPQEWREAPRSPK